MKHFDEYIIKLIEMFSTSFYIIQPDNNIDCVCKNYDTKQGNILCPRCFGLGQKIRIKKINGVRQPESMGVDTMGLSTEKGVYFFKYDYHIKQGDVIIWRNEIENVSMTQRYCSDNSRPVYFYCETVRRKVDPLLFLKNFYRILNL